VGKQKIPRGVLFGVVFGSRLVFQREKLFKITVAVIVVVMSKQNIIKCNQNRNKEI